MKDSILTALSYIPSDDHGIWVKVGMALEHEGYPCSVWDEWSKSSSKYKDGVCEKRWGSFHNDHEPPVTGGTIIDIAKKYGYHAYNSYDNDGVMAFDDIIEYDGDVLSPSDSWDPTGELIKYIEILFEPDEYIGYVTNEAAERDGKWTPSGAGVYTRTAGQVLDDLRNHPDDIGFAVGDCKPEAGAWIRFNPLDGQGVSNNNVTRFTYALVESDDMPIEEQDFLYRKLELPIACLVHSGGKSLHAIVKVDAADSKEYAVRVNTLYDFLEKHGLKVDKNNRNPSRLSRMPGIMRGKNRQFLVATNIGRRSWDDWMDFVEGEADELPPIESLYDLMMDPPPLKPELIEGILRVGHKMIVTAASKAGKSMSLMELAVDISEGREWIGRKCRKGNVLYINLEIDRASATKRFIEIYEKLGLPPKNAKKISMWNLRGHAIPLNELTPKLIRKSTGKHIDAIIIDPIYKVITGDENNASDMGKFCNQFDKICDAIGAASIYCHHHSKGAQGGKRAMDRASGSGVFARDPDAQLDFIELEMTDEVKNELRDNKTDTAWRVESSLREFPNIEPIDVWYSYPLHIVDTTGELKKLYAEGDPKANLQKSGKRTSADTRKENLDKAYDRCVEFNAGTNKPIRVKQLAGYAGVTPKTINNWLEEFPEDYGAEEGVVWRIE